MGRGTRASAGWKQTEKLLFSHCPVPSRSLYIQKSQVTSLKWMALQSCSSWLLLQRTQPSVLLCLHSPHPSGEAAGTLTHPSVLQSDHCRRSRERSPGFLPGHITHLQLVQGAGDAHTSRQRLTAWLLFPTECQLLCPLSWQPTCHRPACSGPSVTTF